MRKKISFKNISVCLVLLIMTALLFSCGRRHLDLTYDDSITEPQYGGVLYTWTGTLKDSLDPLKLTGNSCYKWTDQVFECPLSTDADGEYWPMVCTYEMSDDGKTIKLKVREGLQFHDGTPVEIDDVVASVERACNLHSSIKAQIGKYIKNVEVDEESQTVTYTFTAYNPNTIRYFANYAPMCAVMPKEICEQYMNSTIMDPAACIGTGPYKYAGGTIGQDVVLKRFDNYKCTDAGHTGFAAPKHAYMDEIHVIFSTEAVTDISFIVGEYDLLDINEDYYELAEKTGYKQQEMGSDFALVMHFNQNKNRCVATDVNLKKAILAAVDYETLLQTLYESKYIMTSNPVIGEKYKTDAFNKADYWGPAKEELAKEYLAKSNYNGEEIIILAPAGTATTEIATQNFLSKVGINSKLVYFDHMSRLQRAQEMENSWDIYIEPHSVVTTPSMLTDMYLKTWYTNEKKDALREKLNNSKLGSEEYLKNWNELAEKWADDAEAITLGLNKVIYFQNPDLHINVDGNTIYYHNAWWGHPERHSK